MSRIKPGDLCLIVGEIVGCECNIGATIITTQRSPATDVFGWEFKDASRRLANLGPEFTEYIYASVEASIYGEYSVFIHDRHLIPIRDDDPNLADETLKEIQNGNERRVGNEGNVRGHGKAGSGKGHPRRVGH